MKQDVELVHFDAFGVVEILDNALLESVSAGFLNATVDANGICGSTVNTACYGSNGACLFSPNTVCGTNNVCAEMHV